MILFKTHLFHYLKAENLNYLQQLLIYWPEESKFTKVNIGNKQFYINGYEQRRRSSKILIFNLMNSTSMFPIIQTRILLSEHEFY